MKYKHAESEGWYYTIDDLGNKSQSWHPRNKPGYYKEMMDWVAEGNEIEPQFTAEELEEKEALESEQAIETTQSLCIQYLDESEIHVSGDPPYPGDVPKWKDYRATWRTILKSGKAQKVPDKPF